MKHYQLRITGKVQGVFFRQSSKEKADALGLNGFARNQPDGSVYIEVEGEPDSLQQFVAWCKQGPPMARVEQVTQTQAPVKGYTAFDVRRQ